MMFSKYKLHRTGMLLAEQFLVLCFRNASVHEVSQQQLIKNNLDSLGLQTSRGLASARR